MVHDFYQQLRLKRAVEDHFSYNFEIQHFLKSVGKHAQRKEIKRIADMANFVYIRQKGPYGNVTPILCSEPIVGNEPFAVVWGDEFWRCPGKSHIKQLVEVYEKYGDPVLTAKKITKEETSKYGVIDGVKVSQGVYEVNKLVEKPGPEKAPSTIATLGGYILTPDIFDALKKTKLGKGGELWLIDAMVKVMKQRAIYAKEVDGDYYDTGSKLGYLKANVDEALRRPDVKKEFRQYLKKLMS
jgi:UTP--glucose-1-phosphate uridylyltransferase